MAKKKNRKKNNKRISEKMRKSSRFILPEGAKRWILGTVMLLIAIIIVLSFFNLAGTVGGLLMKTSSFLIGRAIFVMPLVFVIGGLIFFRTEYENFFWPAILAILIVTLGISGTLGCLNPEAKQGGWIGFIISWPLTSTFGFLVAQIIFLAIIIIGGFIFWHLLPRISPKEISGEPEEKESLVARTIKRVRLAPKFKVKEIPPFPSQKEEQVEPKVLTPELRIKKVPQKPLISEYQPPPINLLEPERGLPTSGDTRTNSAIIKKTLQNFSIEVAMSEINIGPTVTQYTLKPAEGVKLSKITTLSNDLSLALASHPIRIEAPIPGRSLVGIEVPNKVRAFVKLKNLIENPIFQRSISNLTFALGKDVAGNPLFADLSKMPHLLVAGATGTGKTIFLNSLILSLLYQSPTNVNPFGGGPETLRFILIDPKRVEFTAYNDLPHLLCPVIYDATKTVNALRWLTGEMERRFEVLAEKKARDVISYNAKYFQVLGSEVTNGSFNSGISDSKSQIPESNIENLELMPYIIVIIDELADLMAAKGREVEAGIVRLAQMARAVGIHLVVATQRPSVEVITGLIKANITSRITFQVASQVDSRTVLDMAGAEKLLGLGDMLYVSAEIVKPKRIQGVYVSDKEVKKITKYIKSKAKVSLGPKDLEIREEIENGLAVDLERSLKVPESKLGSFSREEDPLYEEAKRVVIRARKASASLLQRRLRIGYARAARLIDTLEERGVVGPGEGAKPRKVYIPSEEEGESGWEKI